MTRLMSSERVAYFVNVAEGELGDVPPGPIALTTA